LNKECGVLTPNQPSANPTHSKSDFSGLWIPLITPFLGGAVDHLALKRLVEHYAQCGVAGFVACGSTGEAAALDETEQLAVLDTMISATGNLPLLMGLSGYHLGHTLAWVKTVCQRRLAGILVPPPHYIRPSQAGLLHWFEQIADAANVPVVIYDIPYRTGVTMSRDTLLTLAAHPNIQAIKDCGGDMGKTQALIADGRLQVLAGDDLNIFTTVAVGGVGAIAASAHVRTALYAEVIHSLRDGNLSLARHAWLSLLPIIEAMFAEPNPASIKATLAAQGWIKNELRTPMTQATQPAWQEGLEISRP
jgi:4-hydroxy-tetrahydrodipicolinate synthase